MRVARRVLVHNRNDAVGIRQNASNDCPVHEIRRGFDGVGALRFTSRDTALEEGHMNARILRSAIGLTLLACPLDAAEAIKSERLDFRFGGKRMSGVLDLPADRSPSGIVVFVHRLGARPASDAFCHDRAAVRS